MADDYMGLLRRHEAAVRKADQVRAERAVALKALLAKHECKDEAGLRAALDQVTEQKAAKVQEYIAAKNEFERRLAKSVKRMAK